MRVRHRALNPRPGRLSGLPTEPRVHRGLAAAELALDRRLLERTDDRARWRWYRARRPAIVVGFAQRWRVSDLLDDSRLSERAIELAWREAGGGLVLLDESVLCLALTLPANHRRWSDDVTESYRWLGEALARALRAAGADSARVVGVAEARVAAAEPRTESGSVADLARAVCYAGLSPYEVVVGPAKVVGLAQVRRRGRALFQAGILLRSQSGLADLIHASHEERRQLRALLDLRTSGVRTGSERTLPPSRLAAIADASIRAALRA